MGITESQWDSSRGCIAAMHGYWLLRKNRLGRWGTQMGFNPYKGHAATHTALLGTSDEAVKTLQVRIRVQHVWSCARCLLQTCWWRRGSRRSLHMKAGGSSMNWCSSSSPHRYSLGTRITLIPPDRIIQLGTGNPDFWSVLMVISWCRWPSLLDFLQSICMGCEEYP